MKQCSVADTKTPEFGVLGGVIFKLDILWTGRKITALRERFRLHLPHIKNVDIKFSAHDAFLELTFIK